MEERGFGRRGGARRAVGGAVPRSGRGWGGGARRNGEPMGGQGEQEGGA